MIFKTHVVISLLVALLVFPLFSLNKGIFLLIFLFAALLPDIDSPYSFFGRRIKVIGWIFRHRGIFHSFFMLAALSAVVWVLFNPLYALVFGLGYLAHLLIDMLTYKGIYLFYPLKYRIKGFIKTNSLSEKIIFVVCLVAGFVMLFK